MDNCMSHAYAKSVMALCMLLIRRAPPGGQRYQRGRARRVGRRAAGRHRGSGESCPHREGPDHHQRRQHEITQGLSLTAGYYRNTGGYYRNTDSKVRVNNNLAVGPSDFDTYCITAPSDARLPGGGGYQVCGLSNIKPEKFGAPAQWSAAVLTGVRALLERSAGAISSVRSVRLLSRT
jgi:hypothetical protein